MLDMDIAAERTRRAQECMDSLNRFIGHPTSQHLREQFERRRDAFDKDYGAPYNVYVRKERYAGK
jgi:hypothetical protein